MRVSLVCKEPWNAAGSDSNGKQKYPSTYHLHLLYVVLYARPCPRSDEEFRAHFLIEKSRNQATKDVSPPFPLTDGPICTRHAIRSVMGWALKNLGNTITSRNNSRTRSQSQRLTYPRNKVIYSGVGRLFGSDVQGLHPL